MTSRTNGLIAKLRSIVVYEETDEYVTARAAFGGRWEAFKHLFLLPVIYAVFPERIYKVKFEGDREDIWTQKCWKWRRHYFAHGEWKDGFR